MGLGEHRDSCIDIGRKAKQRPMAGRNVYIHLRKKLQKYPLPTFADQNQGARGQGLGLHLAPHGGDLRQRADAARKRQSGIAALDKAIQAIAKSLETALLAHPGVRLGFAPALDLLTSDANRVPTCLHGSSGYRFHGAHVAAGQDDVSTARQKLAEATGFFVSRVPRDRGSRTENSNIHLWSVLYDNLIFKPALVLLGVEMASVVE